MGNNEVTVATQKTISKNKICGMYIGPGRYGEVVVVECISPRVGKYVTIQTLDPALKVTNIAEVEVIGSVLGKLKI